MFIYYHKAPKVGVENFEHKKNTIYRGNRVSLSMIPPHHLCSRKVYIGPCNYQTSHRADEKLVYW